MRHLVVRPAQLEAEDTLLVFTLEQYGVFQTNAECFGTLQARFNRHVVHAGGQDFFQVVGRR